MKRHARTRHGGVIQCRLSGLLRRKDKYTYSSISGLQHACCAERTVADCWDGGVPHLTLPAAPNVQPPFQCSYVGAGAPNNMGVALTLFRASPSAACRLQQNASFSCSLSFSFSFHFRFRFRFRFRVRFRFVFLRSCSLSVSFSLRWRFVFGFAFVFGFVFVFVSFRFSFVFVFGFVSF